MIRQDINKIVRKGELTKIENYYKAIADETQTWECHHRLELTLEGEFAHSYKDLERMGMYYNRPYFELIFLTRADHNKLHGEARSEEYKQNYTKSRGKPYSEFGKKYYDHFGYSKSENVEQYGREKYWYLTHNKKCSWE